ncbi:MAG: hypothetical protein ACXWZS_06410 [Gemmatirosa sp.]
MAPDEASADAPAAAPAPVHAPSTAPAPVPASAHFIDPFDDLVADVASAIESSVPTWRVRIGEAAARWQAEGVGTAVLERALRLTQPPDVDGLLSAFAAAIGRLRGLEREAVAIDPGLAGREVFRDPARAAEAQALVESLRRARPARAPLHVDPECWVAEWPDVVALLVEDA